MTHRAGAPLKVLHLISSRGFYGAERVVINLAAAMDRRRFIPHLALLRPANNTNMELVEAAGGKEVPAHIISYRKWIDIEALRRLRALILTEGIDIVHCHGMKARLFGLIAPLGTQARIVTTHHNWTQDSFRVVLFESMDAFYIRFFPKIVAVSSEIRDLMRRWMISDGRIEVIFNGLDIDEFRKDGAARDTIRKELRIDRKSPLIGTFGRISPEKGQKYFIAAATRVLDEFPETRFIIVGDGPQTEELKAYTARLGITGRVIFAGFRKNIAEFYSALDLFVLPSILEGTPMSLLEAMSADVPVIATRVGGVGRIIRHGENGLLVSPENPEELALSIIRLLRNPDEMRNMRKEALQTVSEKYSSRKMADEYMKLYGELTSSRQ